MDFTADEYARRDAERLREVLAGPPVTWTFIGDSITQGVVHTHGWRNFVELFAERVRGELGRLGDAVINSGVSGSTAQSLLGEFHWRAGRFAPDVLLVMYGTNDMLDSDEGVRGFRYRLDQIVQQGRDVGATVVLQTPPPVLPDGARTPELMGRYAAAVREVAETLGVVLVDHAAAWERAAREVGSDVAPDGWLDDSCHPGARGHQAMIRTLLATLDLDDPSSPVCSLAATPAVAAPR
ncbi:SGNH/GDSL hydrolase family protein [Intrasporangium calvum]|uniref:Lipolytic protein G-D-S-L family n=1 Tax=Intrasporangium calvum (strain ATCC 23552 / DSM 43043 / JCM 3097 / NBRC 12989 / NCIMB 10167 / NRRL B-3866 / 7 KIP) TaxID=710696 RepID=E6S761_INTC7|nr:SGNH/GDSL hydrolase family protein [Intrasporangium calvum]ADU48995.1 lipolytic protein G-D-S-L family [Intrasporangium calvum DSM 43043]AXG13960.1 SGNH/GDSL hydrolase family protein [Intrasporangium calvum]